ncbi:MAG: hypothetical protein A2271_02105 [Candidatus Moranbacteria bacterium RIFOXYA12_FULL_35_19]|nr:MAG: hypothetical protein UR78_C0022G0013 [Candidatus Moranbacteria bacterium GW2011_GWF2_35_39]OGI31793.1 MAG: hypothetical protein A2343_03460 [Candidatus Moranbacteria bacterium RIFOXYB12_FULL_35_8]OGI32096.1 MAG: hypothetical protein A2489_01665 [Candidatus Moranbacteria bacterium RIFOXYC12_FULL_36_13]OGI36756.1 MAG: hypothetical protein A2271_02105 [Candidatus Moranbacteria bacterium RIFOXYA12_FULL_35_19]
MKQKTRTAYLVVIALALSFGFASFVAVAKNDNANSNSSGSKSEKTKNLKNYEEPTQGKTNASIHKEKTDEISSELLEASEVEKNKGQQNREEKTVENKLNNPNVGQQEQTRKKTREEIAGELEEVAEETEETQDETVEAIEEVEQQNAFKKFLIGTDYKNLGQLRSSLVHNENQIRKLTRLSGSIEDGEVETAVTAQMTLLMQERERIKNIIMENEDGFSLLGWAFRLINGYPKDSIDEQNEEALVQEVEAVVAVTE